jgi:hypothetical protein
MKNLTNSPCACKRRCERWGFELGGEAGARLGKKLSYPGNPDTILRLVKRAEPPTASVPRVVGPDDWSWKRRLRYGTLICESSKPETSRGVS